MNKSSPETTLHRTVQPPADAFARLGWGLVAYVRPMTAAQMRRFYADAPDLPPNAEVWSLNAADGTPILFAESRDLALAGASANDLVPVPLH
jgi:hypothetical protein